MALQQLREADETLAQYVKTATYAAFQTMRREYELQLREEARMKRLEEFRKTRMTEDDETPAKPPSESSPPREREKKKAFRALEKRRSGNRIRTAEIPGRNYATLRGDRGDRSDRGDRGDRSDRGDRAVLSAASDSENELGSPPGGSGFPREASASFYDDARNRGEGV